MCCNQSLPSYTMSAGETKKLTIPIYNSADKQIDMTGTTARFAISDPINQDSEPFVLKTCSVTLPDGSEYAALQVDLNPADTIGLCGQYIYQITIKDQDGRLGVLKGVLTITGNYDEAAISM